MDNERKDSDRTAGLSALLETEYGQLAQAIFISMALAFSTPLESWLRYDFGERYYSRGNYISGLIIMYLWLIIMGALSILFLGAFGFGMASGIDPYAPDDRIMGFFYAITKMLTLQDYDSYALFGGLFYIIWLGHVVLGSYHLYRMWYRDRTSQALHSYEIGKSRLTFLTKMLFKPINLVANSIVKALAITIPSHLRTEEQNITPVFYDTGSFTKQFIEPVVGFILGLLFVFNGFILLGLYFIFAGLGLAYISRIQYQTFEGEMLDLRDQYIQQVAFKEKKEYAQKHDYNKQGESTPGVSVKAEFTALQITKMMEKDPSIAADIKEESPSLFEMMEDINPNLRNMGKNKASSEETQDNLI